MSLTTIPSSNTIQLAVRGLAGVLVDTSRVNDDKVRAYVRVLHNGVLLGESPHSHPLRPTGNVIYSLQRYVALWSQLNEKLILLEASTDQVLRLEVCLQLQNGDSWRIGSGDREFSKTGEDVSDVEIVCSLSEDEKDFSPYRIDPRGDAVLRVAVISPDAKNLHEERHSPLLDPPGFESKSGPVEPFSEHTLEPSIKAFLEKSTAPVKVEKPPSLKKKVTFSPTKLETKFIIPANKKPLHFFPNIFGGGFKDRKGKLRENVRGRNGTTTTATPRSGATATKISVAPVVPRETFSPESVTRLNIHSADSNMKETSFVWNGSPLRRDTADTRHRPEQQSTRPVFVSPDPPERSVRLPKNTETMSSSSIEKETELVCSLDGQISPDSSEIHETDDVRFNRSMEQSSSIIAAAPSAIVGQETGNNSATTPVIIAQENTLGSNATALTISGMASYPIIIPDDPKFVLMPSHSQTDQLDHEGIATALQDGCSLTHCIPVISDGVYQNGNVENNSIPSKSQSAPDQVDLVWDSYSPGSSIEACDDSEVTIESHSYTAVGKEFHLLYSFDLNKDKCEEGGHHSWISAKDDDLSFFTAGDIISGC